MSALARLFTPLRRAAAAFFKHDLALRRVDTGVRIVFEPRGTSCQFPSRAEIAAQKSLDEVALMRAQLAALLDELPETRQAMRHLVFVDSALARKGLRALHQVPLDVLQRALEQLEGLVTNWSPVGLAGLRSKMAVAIIDREHMDPDAEADAYRTAAVFDATPPPVRAEAQTDEDALAAAYAALGSSAPAGFEVQSELGSPSARALAASVPWESKGVAEVALPELQG